MALSKTQMAAIAEHFTVPDHIRACANSCRYDLLYGPTRSRIPAAGIESYTDDDIATYADDLELSEGDTETETYTGPVGDALRQFIEELPPALYLDEDGFIQESEPQGEYLNSETMEPCESDDDNAEYFEPTGYYALQHSDIVEALFGATISREFR